MIRFSIVVFALAVAVCSRSVAAQTGSLDPTPEELSSMSQFVPTELELIEQPAVDLRRWMPPVGMQLMNDCTAWAVAYGAKTYAEARDQGWKPDSPTRIFSPRFVYNQINNGEDNGSNFAQAIFLMRDNGAATLASSPYKPGDFSSAPSDKALNEAKAFPVHDGRLLKSRKAIRRALQRREVVIFGAHVGPTFLSGRFEIYSPDLFVNDSVNRKPDQRHGKHAMVIVGYDDSKQAFLVQNSWGEDWNWHGYAWVSYELFDTIEIENEGMIFCNWACTIVDVEEPVVVGSDGVPRPAPLDLATLRIRGYSDIVRYDPDLQKYLYVFTAELNGQTAALDKVESVTWTWVDEKGISRSVPTTLKEMRFPIQAGTSRNPLEVEAELTMDDGSTRTLEAELTGPNAKADFRDARIYFEHEYFGKQQNKSVWEWSATLDYPLEQRMDIVKVVWKVGDMNWRDPVQVNDGFNAEPADERAIGFATKAGPVSAEIHYNDGGIKTVSAVAEFTDPAEDHFHLEVDKHIAGVHESGDPLYSVRVALDFPRQRRFDVKRVIYKVDNHISPTPLIGYQSFHAFQAFLTTHRDFRVVATIEFEDGTTQTFNEWVTLGEGTSYKNPLNIELAAADWYTGRHNGEPKFTAKYSLIGDQETLRGVREVHIRDADDPEGEAWVVSANEEGLFEVLRFLEKAETNLVGTVHFSDDSTLALKTFHARQSHVDDVIGLAVKVKVRDKLEALQDPHLLYSYTASLAGPFYAVRNIHRVDWIHTVGGREEYTRCNAGWLDWREAFNFTSSFDKPFVLTAVLHDTEGYQERISIPVSAASSGEYRPAIDLALREKFHGYSETSGRPVWSVIASLRYDESEFASKPKEVIYSFKHISTGVQMTEHTFGANVEPDFHLSRPTEFNATVVFEDGSTHVITKSTYLTAPRSISPLWIEAYQVAGSNVKDGRLVLQGHRAVQQRIRKVVLDLPGEDRDAMVEYEEGWVPNAIAFDFDPNGVEAATMTVTLEDGSSHDFMRTIDFSRKPISTSVDERYWGDGEWEITCIPTGSWWPDLSERTYWKGGFDHYFMDLVHAWPPGIYRMRSTPGVAKLKPRPWRDDAVVRESTYQMGPIEGRPDDWKSNVTESLVLKVERPIEFTSKDTDWTLFIDGPERDMIRVASVRYRWKEDEVGHDIAIGSRWGSYRRGFETHAYGAVKPTPQAVVTFKDGSTLVLAQN